MTAAERLKAWADDEYATEEIVEDIHAVLAAIDKELGDE